MLTNNISSFHYKPHQLRIRILKLGHIRTHLRTPPSLEFSPTGLAPNNSISFTWNGKEDQVSYKAQQVQEIMNSM